MNKQLLRTANRVSAAYANRDSVAEINRTAVDDKEFRERVLKHFSLGGQPCQK